MRWILLIVGIALHTLVIGQATLKIYVATDDVRSDMDIIYLNTSTLDEYGQSVDSTNTNYYTTTMATQVFRINRDELFGSEEKIVDEIEDDQDGAGIDDMDGNVETAVVQSAVPRSQPVDQNVESSTTSSTRSVAERSISSSSGTPSFKAQRFPQKGKRPKKSKRNKKYRGQCPKFF